MSNSENLYASDQDFDRLPFVGSSSVVRCNVLEVRKQTAGLGRGTSQPHKARLLCALDFVLFYRHQTWKL